MARQQKTLEAAPPAEMPVHEIKHQYPEHWLLLGVTRRNERDEPTHGCLLYASESEGQADKRLKDELEKSGARYSGIAIFWADPRFPGIVPGIAEPA